MITGWKPYYKYDCTHALCNAPHLRELTRAWEQDDQKWDLQINKLLETINREVTDAGGALNAEKSQKYRQEYRKLIKQAEIECPDPPRPKGKKGRVKKSKPRNLLERLRDYEDDTLRFVVICQLAASKGSNQAKPWSFCLAERNLTFS